VKYFEFKVISNQKNNVVGIVIAIPTSKRVEIEGACSRNEKANGGAKIEKGRKNANAVKDNRS